MNELDDLKIILRNMEKERANTIQNQCDDYGVEYNESDEDDIISEIDEWELLRDLDYHNHLACVMENLKAAIEEFNKGTQKDIHRANKAFERVVTETRQNREELEDQIEQIERVILQYDDIICLCNKFRKQIQYI